ncbi:MAG TPA: helix-turn-helix domain-containing protein [Solirubrobacterales bacterium]|nr:helix-turn-helix domain-containing protein [Solirubrobacterales bacterium]
MARATEQQSAQALVERLGERREEIEQTLLTRVYAVSDPAEVGDPEYADGLKGTVSAAMSYGLAAIQGAERPAPPIPAELRAQARRAAGSGVRLDTVLRRYIAGYAVLEDFIVQEAEVLGMRRGSTQRALRAEAVLLDRLLDAVAAEYRDEVEQRACSRHRQQAECVKALLAGRPTEPSRLDYEFGGWHLGVIAFGPEAEGALRGLAKRLDRRPLLVPNTDGVVWAWLGGARKPDPERVERLASDALPGGIRLAIGEPAMGLSGWRLTHRQAAAALLIARRGEAPTTRYAHVSLLASILQDEVLTRSLQDLYLTPLARARDGGDTFRETLRAYFSAERNAAAAAAALGVSRQTVNNRLRAVEELLERPLGACASELEVALRLKEIEAPWCDVQLSSFPASDLSHRAGTVEVRAED